MTKLSEDLAKWWGSNNPSDTKVGWFVIGVCDLECQLSFERDRHSDLVRELEDLEQKVLELAVEIKGKIIRQSSNHPQEDDT